MDKLDELLAAQEKMMSGLETLNQKVEDAKNKIVQSRGQKLFEMVRDLGEEFKTGVVAQKFDKIQKQMLALQEVDSGYLGKLGADAYGQTKDAEGQYIAVHLFGSVWREDSSLWRVLEKVVDSQDIAGNPFVRNK